jgi:predicted transcriptional regulator
LRNLHGFGKLSDPFVAENRLMSDTLTVELDDPTLDALDRLAAKTEQSRASLVSQAVQDYIELNTWQLRKIEAGIEAADRGDFASDADVARVRAKFASRA